MVVMAAYSIYSISLVVKEFSSSRGKLDLTPKMPDDRCVSWFSAAQKAFQRNGSLLYHYEDGTATLRVCTDLDAEDVDKVLGKSDRYDVFAVASSGQCSIYNVSASNYYSCPGSANSAQCQAAIDEQPFPYGIAWAYEITNNATDPDAFTLSLLETRDDPEPCQMALRRMGGVTESCNRRFVWAYQRSNALIKLVSSVSLGFTILFFLMELCGMHAATKAGNDDEQGFLWAVSEDGSTGALYLVVRVFYCKRPAPKEHDMKTWEFFALISNTVVCDIVMPAIAISGCSINENTKLMALLIAGLVNTSIGLATAIGKCCIHAARSKKAGGGILEMVANPLRKS